MALPFSEITGDWSDQPLYIIGGGPSLEGFDFSKLDGRKLGANKSAWVADCDAMCTLDQHFARMARQDIEKFVLDGGEAYLAMPPNENDHVPIPGATYVVRRRNGGLSDDPRDLYGVNSGYACLGLAYLKGAKEIALLGFDMKAKIDRKGSLIGTHWHGGYQWHNSSNHRYYDRWASNFEKAAQQLSKVGANVVNFVGSNGSAITAFPTAPLEDLV